MGTILITYSDLSESAKRASDAANKLSRYADDIPSVATSPLSSLPGSDSSGYVSSAISLAQQKANSLRDRAGRYSSYSSKVNSFVSNAKTADSNVSRSMDSLANQIVGNQSLWDQLCYGLYKIYCSTIGSTELGAIFDNILSEAHDWADKWVTKAYDCLVHGGGQYILNMAIALAAAAGAVLALVTLPISGPLAVAAAVCLTIAAVVSVVDTAAAIADNEKARDVDETDPGLARYYGKTSTISDWMKKHTNNSTLQTAATVFDVTGVVAGILGNVLSLGLNTSGVFEKSAIKENVAGKFGFKFDKTSKAWKFGFGNLFGLKAGETKIEIVKNINSFSKNVLKTFNNTITTIHDHSISLKTGIGTLSAISPAFKGLSDIVSNINAFKDYGGLKVNPEISWSGSLSFDGGVSFGK